VLIRSATPQDISAIRALEEPVATAAHWHLREYDALFAPEAPRRVALVAEEEDQQICGFIVARCGLEEWEIENVVVAIAYRRRGIGRELVRMVVRLAGATAAAVLLEVRESNTPARQLYEKLGFVEIGRRTAYYHDPVEDALLLRFSPRKM
jgi:[ribosomal protein S18]-alanine N-acetyltransferase